MPKKDERGSKVEKYKLTPEQMKFQKQFKRARDVGDLLQNMILKNMLEGQELADYMRQLQVGLRQMKAPSDKVQELPGENFGGPEEEVMEEGPTKQDLYLRY